MKEKGRNRNLSFECIETKVVIDSQMRNIFKQHIKFKKKTNNNFELWGSRYACTE